MSRRDRGMDQPELSGQPPPSKCAKVLYYTWKLCSVVFSHLVMISLVVAYCFVGAVTFEKLEAEHEKEVKRNVSRIRNNTTQSIWGMTRSVPLLNQTNWTSEVVHMLKDFESSILLEMKVRGWDGSESLDHIQWTFTGALFYSIIVITTIGYGHIAPKTQAGKVVTIFYAILGIPLMLLCLSNIGDVMASSFRFLYWRVCCYLCTRPPKRRRRHVSTRRSVRGRPASMRRKKPLERAHSDTDFRYRDSGYSSGRARRQRPPSARAPRTRSQPPSYLYDQELYNDDAFCPPQLKNNRSEFRIEHENDEFPKISLPLQDLAAALEELEKHQQGHTRKSEARCTSLPRPPKSKPDYGSRKNMDSQRLYDLHEKANEMYEMHDLHDVDRDNFREKQELEERNKKIRKKFESFDYFGDKDHELDEVFDVQPQKYQTWDGKSRRYRGRSEYYERDRTLDRDSRRGRRARSAAYDSYRRWDDYGPRFEDDYYPKDWYRDFDTRGRRCDDDRDERRDPERGRGRRLRRLQTFEDRPSYEDRYSPSPAVEDWSDEEAYHRSRRQPQALTSRQLEIVPVAPEQNSKEEIKPVPIWLCVFLVASYIVLGTFLFKQWEGWPYLDAAYFCFITLTTIGFGDFVPAQGATGGTVGDAAAAVHSIALCSLYLLFGIALLAMSFNLVQEEVRANVAALAMQLGIIKPQKTDEESESE